MLRNEVMASRCVGNHRTRRCDRLTIRPFPSSLHRRRRTMPVTSARRRTIFVSSLMSTIMCTPSAISRESPACKPAAHSATCGRSTAYSGSHRISPLATARSASGAHGRCRISIRRSTPRSKLGGTGASKAALMGRGSPAPAFLVVKILLSGDYGELDRLSNNSISRKAVLSIS
jgi:hypothetical protein